MSNLSVWFTPFVLVAMMLVGCQTYTSGVENEAGRPTVYSDPGTASPMAGIGIESQDIISMTDKMMRDMLSNPTLAKSSVAPRVIIDAEYFVNEGSSTINKNLLTDRLRVELNRAASGRISFMGRHYAAAVEQEQELKARGVVAPGTRDITKLPAGADFRLGGRVATLDSAKSSSGLRTRFHQITYEMFSLATGEIVWSGIYDFRKSAQDDIIYR